MEIIDFLTFIWVSTFFLIFYTYIIYPAVIAFISLFYKNKIKSDFEPTISLVISVFNEDKVISDRIKNIAEQEYDFNKLEVLVGSDNSIDKTNDILIELKNNFHWLKVFTFKERSGKAGVINKLIPNCKNEILIFTDANTIFEKKSLKNLAAHFNEEKIGGVSGKLILSETKDSISGSVEEKKYWEYETLIKKSEGKCGILIGANGGIFAIRKSLFEIVPTDKAVTDDFFISLNVLKKGFKFIYDEKSIAYENVSEKVIDEFKRKIRFMATNIQTLFFMKELIFNKKNLLISFSFISHKIIRWIIPFLLILLLVLNLFLFSSSKVFNYFFYLQIAFYFFGLLGYLFSLFNFRITLFSIIYFFLMSNLALLIGTVKFFRGKHSVIWQPSSR